MACLLLNMALVRLNSADEKAFSEEERQYGGNIL